MPGIASVPPTDRDEARFMQASKQMLETGDVMTIRFQDEMRTKKPVGIHWLQVASVSTLAGGDLRAVWAYRLPSVLAAWFTVLVTFGIGRRLFGSSAGLLGAGLLACTLLMTVEAHIAKTDATLVLAVTLAHLALLEFYLAPSHNRPTLGTVVLFWCAIGFGLLIKGPVIAVVVGATTLALCFADRRADWLSGLQPAIGIPIAISFLMPWLTGSVLSGNGDVILASLAEDFLPKLVSGQESHGAPPGSYLTASPLILWPASLLIFPGLVWAWRYRQQPPVRFALAWGLASWLVFELVPTKLPHYVLPALPGLALSAAAGLLRTDFPLPGWSKLAWGFVSAALASVVIWAAWTYDGSHFTAGLIGFILLITTALTWTPQKHLEALVPGLAVSVFGLIFMVLLPSLTDLSLSTRLAKSIQNNGGGSVALSRFHEPSAVFLLGTETWLTNRRNAVAHIAADPSAVAVVAADEVDLVVDMLTAIGGVPEIVDQLSGYNYAKGRPEQMVVIRHTVDQPDQ